MFVKGKKSKPGPGRPKGAENQKTKEARGIARKLATDKTYQANLIKRLIEGTAGPMEPCIWQYAFGKPKDSLDLNLDLTKLSDEELDQLEALVKRVG